MEPIGILYPFLGHPVRNMAVNQFNNRKTELLCQDSAGVNNSGLTYNALIYYNYHLAIPCWGQVP